MGMAASDSFSPTAREERVKMFQSIVWANDWSEAAQDALPLVKDLARAGGGKITIVHVVERIEGSGAVGLPRRADEAEVQGQLEELTANLRQEGLDATLEIRGDVGDRPAHEVASIARQLNADLIVVGTRGRSAIGGLLLGSVTNRLLHIAPCPVLSVPPPRK
jgi:nucleotide-binding universal stress UspA family protein